MKIASASFLICLFIVSMVDPSTANARPAWVDQPPKSSSYRYYVGVSSPTSEEQTGRREAFRDALQQLVESFGIIAKSGYTGERTEATNTIVDKLTASSEAANIRGLDIQSTYTEQKDDKNTVFVLVRIKHEAYDVEKERIEKEVSERLSLSMAVNRIATMICEHFTDQDGKKEHTVQIVVGPSRRRNPVVRTIEPLLAAALSNCSKGRIVVSTDSCSESVGIDYSIKGPDNDISLISTIQSNGKIIWGADPVVASSELLPRDVSSFLQGAQVGESGRQMADESVSKPRLMVVIREANFGRSVPNPSAETEITRQFVEAGYDVVDQSRSEEIRESQERLAEALHKPEVAASIGRAAGADIVVVGEALAEPTDSIYRGIYSCRARVEGRAIRCDTAQILATNGFYAGASDIGEFICGKKALSKAGHELGDYLVQKISQRLIDQDRDGNAVAIAILGVDYDQFRLLVSRLKEKAHFLSETREVSYLNGAGEISATIDDDIDVVSREILNIFPQDRYRIVEKTGNKITISSN